MSVHVLANVSRDDLPFRAMEAAHRRLKRAEAEYALARAELAKACEQMREAGYVVSEVSAALTPPLPERFTSEIA